MAINTNNYYSNLTFGDVVFILVLFFFGIYFIGNRVENEIKHAVAPVTLTLVSSSQYSYKEVELEAMTFCLSNNSEEVVDSIKVTIGSKQYFYSSFEPNRKTYITNYHLAQYEPINTYVQWKRYGRADYESGE